MGKILNVTMEEFCHIKDIEMQCWNTPDGRFNEGRFAALISKYYTGARNGPFRVIVRRDVPSVPWLSANVQRIENDTEE